MALGVASASNEGIDPSKGISKDVQGEPSFGMEDPQSIVRISEDFEVGVDAKDKYGDSPLHLAVQSGNLVMVMSMVATGKADVNARGGIYGYTPLHLAVRSGRLDIVMFMVAEGKANVNAHDEDDETPLYLAIRVGKLDIVKYMVVEGKACVNAHDRIYGFTPLHWAVRCGKLDVVKFMVDDGKANVNAQAKNGDTPLHTAVQFKRLAIVKFIVVEGKANVDASDENGVTPLHLAIRLGELAIVKFMVVEGKAIMYALDGHGTTSLHLAVRYAMLDIVKFLVVEGNTFVNAQADNGETPLHWAVRLELWDIVKFMVAEGNVDVNAQDGTNGFTPLHMAVRLGKLDIVKFMVLEGKTNVNVQAKDGATALHLAVRLEKLDIVEFMVAMHLKLGNFDVNFIEAETGYTTLHCAIQNGKDENINLVRELLKCKETLRLTDECKSGKTPLEIAHDRGFKNIEKSLLECEGVQRFVDELYRDRQAYVDAANAILVGAALIASVTFASWLQPPFGIDTNLGYVDVQHGGGLQAFWIFNCLSFYFAIGTVVFGARSVLPRGHDFIKVTVEKLQMDLLNTAKMLACSVLCVIIAFGIAGSIVLPPKIEHKLYMIIPTIIGGLVCIGSIGSLFKSVLPDSFFGKNTT